MKSNLTDMILSAYECRYKQKSSFIVSAPGRINLIGEHTDYSEGFVLPVAIDRSVNIAFTPREDNIVHAYSLDFDEDMKVRLDNLTPGHGGWKDYIMGMAWAMMDSGLELTGWQGVIVGNIPIGAGLSSSAALEVGVGKTFCISSDFDLSPANLAIISRKAESDWVGVNVGIMDQLISAAGKKNHALLLDCRTLSFDYVPVPEQISFIVLDTKTRRELTHSNYNARHEEVKKAAEILDLPSLRDASPSLIEKFQNKLPPILFRRAKHVVTENERVTHFTKAMRNSDLILMGKLMNESHASLKDDYEVSSCELDLIVELAQNQANCIGARMMGAGFGGCALALLKNDDTSLFTKKVFDSYYSKTSIEPHIFKVESTSGVQGYSTSKFMI